MTFKDIRENTRLEEMMLKYEFALNILETHLNILIKEFAFSHGYNPVDHVKSRIKEEASALKKLEKKGYELTYYNLVNHIHDMIGIRIVCSFLSDVYDIVELIKASPQFKLKEEKDYIKHPKKSGYISYHLLVLVPIYLNDTIEYVEAEIQIRTMAMDFWASLDHKIQYKFIQELPKEIGEELYSCSLTIQELDRRMNLLNDIVKNYEKKDV